MRSDACPPHGHRAFLRRVSATPQSNDSFSPSLTSTASHSQPFWGDMVAAAGAGPRPIPQKELSSGNLAQAIEFCLTEAASTAATTMSRKMRTEFGVQQAVDTFHSNLPLPRLRCHILKDRPAAWSYVTGDKEVHLSKLAAQILVDNGYTTWSSLGRYEPSPIRTDVRRWDPASAVASSLAGTWTGMATSAADIVIKPIKAYQRPEASAGHEPESLLAAQVQPSSKPSELNHHGPGASGPLDVGAQALGKTPQSRACSGRFARAALGSASGVGGFFHHFSKGMLLDMPLAATEGLRAVPKLYGGEVSERRHITDWKSGAIVAGTNFQEGVVGGFTDLVREPIEGGRQEGVMGVVKGVGKGLVGMTTKVTSGAFWFHSYQGSFSSASRTTDAAE